MEVKMKKLGLLTVGFIFLFVGMGFAATDFAKYSTLKTDEKVFSGAGSITSTTTTTRVERSAVRPATEVKAPALKAGGGLAGYKAIAIPQAKPAVGPAIKAQAPVPAVKGYGIAVPTVVTIPANKVPATKVIAPAAQKGTGIIPMPKAGGGIKTGGGTGQIGFGK